MKAVAKVQPRPDCILYYIILYYIILYHIKVNYFNLYLMGIDLSQINIKLFHVTWLQWVNPEKLHPQQMAQLLQQAVTMFE